MREQPLWQRRMFQALTSTPLLTRLREADQVFLAMHGGWGEDGRLQALLEMAGIGFTGAGSSVCAAAWRKDQSLAMLRAAGVPVTEQVRHPVGQAQPAVEAEALLASGPVVVKPIAGGSSVNVRIAHTAAELRASVSDDEEWVIETFLPGREFTVGVVGETVMPVVEIEISEPLFDYQSKYQPGAAREICPADIPADLATQMQKYALLAHQALGFDWHTYSRVDFRCDAGGAPVCLEVNALPGLTPGSLLPLAAQAAGWPYPELVERLIALKRRPRARTADHVG